MALSNLTVTDLERPKSSPLRFSVVGYLYGIDIFASSNITALSWMSQKGLCLRAGLSAVPALFVYISVHFTLPPAIFELHVICGTSVPK